MLAAESRPWYVGALQEVGPPLELVSAHLEMDPPLEV